MLELWLTIPADFLQRWGHRDRAGDSAIDGHGLVSEADVANATGTSRCRTSTEHCYRSCKI